jgi:xylose isomerase
MGNLTEIGFWENYFVYEVEDHVMSRLDLVRTRPVMLPSKDVAMGWLFALAQTDSVKVSNRGGICEYVQGLSGGYIPYTKERIKYTITEKDIENGVNFAKLVLHEKVDRDFENMWLYMKPQPHSPLLAQYARDYAESTDPLREYISKRHAQHDAKFAILANALFDTHVMIDQMAERTDVHALIVHHFNQVNDLPKMLKDTKTDNVQRTAKS